MSTAASSSVGARVGGVVLDTARLPVGVAVLITSSVGLVVGTLAEGSSVRRLVGATVVMSGSTVGISVGSLVSTTAGSSAGTIVGAIVLATAGLPIGAVVLIT